MITVRNPPFEASTWTHVAFTWQRFNAEEEGRAVLYLNGKSTGDLRRRQRFQWDPKNVVIMLGINYVGGLDELAIFDRALTADEVKELFKRPMPGGSETSGNQPRD